MAAKDLFYELGLPLNYGDLKHAKWKMMIMATTFFHSFKSGLFYDQQVVLDAAKNGTIFSKN